MWAGITWLTAFWQPRSSRYIQCDPLLSQCPDLSRCIPSRGPIGCAANSRTIPHATTPPGASTHHTTPRHAAFLTPRHAATPHQTKPHHATPRCAAPRHPTPHLGVSCCVMLCRFALYPVASHRATPHRSASRDRSRARKPSWRSWPCLPTPLRRHLGSQVIRKWGWTEPKCLG